MWKKAEERRRPYLGAARFNDGQRCFLDGLMVMRPGTLFYRPVLISSYWYEARAGKKRFGLA